MQAENIQADYEQLEQMAADMGREADQLQQLMITSRQKLEGLLSTAWQGEAAGAYLREMQDVTLPGMKRLTEALCQSEETIKQLVRDFSTAENDGASIFFRNDQAGNNQITVAGFTYGNGLESAGSSSGFLNEEDMHFLNDAGKAISLATSAAAGILSTYLGNHPQLTNGFGLAGLALNFLTDEDFQTDPLRALTGELGKFLAKKVITRFIPGAGTLLLASDVIQLIGFGVTELIEHGFSNPELAEDFRWGFKAINLSGHLEWLFEKAYDFLSSPSPAGNQITGTTVWPSAVTA